MASATSVSWRINAGATALVGPERTWSYAELGAEVRARAERLKDEGFLLNRDSKEIVERAEASDIP